MSGAEVRSVPPYEQARAEQDARRRVAREQATAGAARQACDELITTLYREKFEMGDREKLLRCVELCEATDTPIPTWARRALAVAFSEWREAQAKAAQTKGKALSLDRCIFGKRTGRHTNLATAERDRHRRQVIFEAVETVRHCGIERDQSFATASKLLKAYSSKYTDGVNASAQAIKATYYQMKKKGAERDRAIAAEMALLTPDLPEFSPETQP
jgi:hypothetical protein